MSIHKETKLKKPKTPLQDFIGFTNRHNYKPIEGLDNVTFDNDVDSLKRRAAYCKDKSHKQVLQVLKLTHLIKPEDLHKTKDEASFIKGQWPLTWMRKFQKTHSVKDWLYDFGREFVWLLWPHLDDGHSIEELLDISKRILGWKNNYHMTKFFKELYLLGYNIDPTVEIKSCGTYGKLGMKFIGVKQEWLIDNSYEIGAILKYPYNVEHNLCNWIKYLLREQE